MIKAPLGAGGTLMSALVQGHFIRERLETSVCKVIVLWGLGGGGGGEEGVQAETLY